MYKYFSVIFLVSELTKDWISLGIDWFFGLLNLLSMIYTITNIIFFQMCENYSVFQEIKIVMLNNSWEKFNVALA